MTLSRSAGLLAVTLSSLGGLAIAACSASATNRDVGGGQPDGGPVLVSDDGGASSCKADPGNFDFPGDNCDNDGDGTTDNPPSCDDALDIDGNADEFARALGLCKTSSNDKEWGVVSAKYVDGYGSKSEPEDHQHGILQKFGNVLKPTEGTALGVLSTGFAREFNDAAGTKTAFKGGGGFGLGGGAGVLPQGYPKAAKGCTVADDAHNVAIVKLDVRVPNNAKGLSFDFNFFSAEWPEFVCTTFNDGFLAFLQSEEFNGGTPENISFDAQNNPVSVNNGFFDRCTPNTKTCGEGKSLLSACAGGEAELQGTGFYNKGTYCSKPSTGGGATGWLTTQAPVKPGETITLQYIIWNTGDEAYQSSVLLDNFRWEASEVVVGTDRPN